MVSTIQGEAGKLMSCQDPREGSWWSRSMYRDALLNDVSSVHLRDVITVWIWNLLLLLHRQGRRLCWLRLLLLFLLPPREKTASAQDTPQGQAQGSQGRTHFWKQPKFSQPSHLLLIPKCVLPHLCIFF